MYIFVLKNILIIDRRIKYGSKISRNRANKKFKLEKEINIYTEITEVGTNCRRMHTYG